MTDEQTIKAFEYCMNQNECSSCCPYDDDEDTNEGCTSKLVEDVLDLIKRQQAEIERLKPKCEDCAGCSEWKCDCANIKSEAYEEFAERLKDKACLMPIDDTNYAYVICGVEIDDIVKELTEGSTEEVKCMECEHLMFSDMYGECSKGHRGIVRPDDSCMFGKRKVKDDVN